MEYFFIARYRDETREIGPYPSQPLCAYWHEKFRSLHHELKEGVVRGYLSLEEALAHNDDYVNGEAQDLRHLAILRSPR